MSKQTIAAIPTTYNGVKFRSRLEAKWAAFFDLLGWQWAYEPFDLNGWIPDFVIGKHPIAVETKPFTQVKEIPQYYSKLENSGWEKPIGLFGATFLPATKTDAKFVGAIGIRTFDTGFLWRGGCFIQCHNCDIGICYRGRRCMICKSITGDEEGPFTADPTDLWIESGNTVQWKGR